MQELGTVIKRMDSIRLKYDTDQEMYIAEIWTKLGDYMLTIAPTIEDLTLRLTEIEELYENTLS